VAAGAAADTTAPCGCQQVAKTRCGQRMHQMMQHKMQDPAEAEKFFQEDDKQ
jgi:hypothetical protein